LETKTTEVKCNKCGKAMNVKDGKFGQFLACSGYPECKNTMNATQNDKGEIVAVETQTTDAVCELCGKPMVFKHGRFGQFLGCSGYPECKNIINMQKGKDGEMVPKVAEVTDAVCDKCGKPMAVKHGKFGKFLGCTGYPECKNIQKIHKTPSAA